MRGHIRRYPVQKDISSFALRFRRVYINTMEAFPESSRKASLALITLIRFFH